MGLLSSGIKAARTAKRAVPDATDYTKPKKKINPLVKPREQIFEDPTTDDFIATGETMTTPHGDPVQVIGRMYSPVYSAIEEMPIGKQGTKGENITAYLNKRAPNVEKSELESFELNLNPNRRYTKEEVLSLAKEKGSQGYTIEKDLQAKFRTGPDSQRQNVTDTETDYVELMVQGMQPYARSAYETHFGGQINIAHTRSSIRSELPEGGPLAQKISDRPRYLLIEEMQSDLAKRRNTTQLKQENLDIAREYDISVPSAFDDFIDEMNIDYNIYTDRNVIKTIQKHYYDMYSPDRIEGLDELKKVREDNSFKTSLIKKLKEEHNIDAQGKDIDTVSLDAIRKSSDTSQGEADWNSGGEYQIEPDQRLENETKDLFKRLKNTVGRLYGEKSQEKSVSILPLANRTEYVKKLILANIAYAKQNNVNKIVIPNYKEIAKQRIGGFEMVLETLEETDPLVVKYNKAVREGTVNELAQEYYEGVFKTIYKDAVKKAINQLNNETNNALKTKTKELTYPDLTKPNRIRKSNALEIDITDFVYDPKTDAFRFNKGGAVGTKTNKKTQAGRDVYKTPEGEMVSEKSTTFKYKGQWINIPSIHEGNRYDDDTLILMLEAGLIEPTSVHKSKEEAEQAARKRSDSLKFNQGGTPMLEQQMELFEDGGLKDEGGEIDEVSGNEVPIGGTKKGVRDDVPAMVSEGEFVFPEDVTRYIGLDKLMQMRQEAKMGLKRMEAMGQMGNGDEATMPDDLPFDMADLIIVAGDTGEELEMQEGGFVTRPTTARRTQPQQQPTILPMPPAERPPEFRSTRALTPAIERPARTRIDFSKIMGDASIEFKEYRNEEGTSTLVAFIGGKPVYPIPDGYTLYTGEDAADKTEEAVVKANAIVPKKDKYEMPDFLKPKPPEATDWANLSTDELIDELGSVTGTARLITKGAMLLMGPVGIAGSFMMKDQDKNVVAAIDAALARGGLSSEDRATLTAAKEELTKSGMLDFLDPIIDGVAGALGISTEEVDNSVNTAVATGAVQESRARPATEEPVKSTKSFEDLEAEYSTSPAPKPEETVSQAQQNFLEGAYNVASADPDAAFENVVKRQRATDLEKARADIQTLRSGETLPEGYEGGVGSKGYNKALRDLSNIYGADTVREAESSLLPNRFAPVGGVPSISQARMEGKPEEATRDLSGIPTAMDRRANIAARPTPQVELTQQPTPVTDAYVGSLDAASQYRQQPTTTQPSVQSDLFAVPEYMDTDTSTPSYVDIPESPRVPRRFVGVKPFRTQDTSDTLAAYDRSPAPQESGTFTKDGISMLPSADESDLSTEAYIAGDRAGVLSQTTPYSGVSPNTQGTAGNRAGVSTQQPPSLQEQALNLLSPEAQTRVLDQDIDATIANAKKVVSDSTVETSLRPKARPSVTDQVKALGIDVDSPFATATPTKAPVAAPLRSFSDAESIAKRAALAARPTPLVTTEEPVDTAPSYATMPVGEKGRGVVSTGKGRDIDKAFDPKEKGGTETFDEAFARNKREGKKTFTYKGKKYTTETKEEKAAKPKRDTGSKSNRLDQSNPNSEINFNEHLADWEKEQARSNPALAQHFIITANRRENDKKKTGKDPADKVSAKKHDESGGLGGFFKGLFGAEKGGLATRR
jgi:hypothetical protein